MSEQTWTPQFRAPASTVTKVLRSPAFIHSRERAHEIIDDPIALRELGETVDGLDYTNTPLAGVADRVAAACRFLYARADYLDSGPGSEPSTDSPAPGPASPPLPGGGPRERLIVAALHYLVTPVDLVPDARIGGYVDDVLLLSWVFGAAVTELETYLVDDDAEQ